MSWQIIHDDDVAATEGWCEALLDVREEDGAVHRSINQEGSDNPVVAQAATNVIVFQCPCGTDAISRSPRGQRPLSRTMFVLVAVSSINTSRAGSACLALVPNVGGRGDIGSFLLCRVQAFF